MDISAVKAFLEDLQKELSDLGIESKFTEGIGDPQVGETLRILFPVTEDGNAVITEVMVTEFSSDLDMLLLYSTIAVNIGKRYDELVDALVPWNMTCPLGAFGIYEEGKQLYHKYSFPFPNDASPNAVSGQAMVMLGIINEVLSQRYDEAVSYSDN